MSTLFSTLLSFINETTASFEIIAIDDGSQDNTLAALKALQATLPQLRIVELSRNFGKEAALTAGLAASRGQAVIAIDADLQDPPRLIPQMFSKWQEGYDVVTAVRGDRATDSFVKRLTAGWFYKLINKVSDVKLPPHAGDFRLFDRKVIDAFLSLPERVRFNKGLFAWLGFKSYLIEHTREKRVAGTSQWKLRKLFLFAIDGVTSFTSTPLKIWSYLGFVIAMTAALAAFYVVGRTLLFGKDAPGYASIIVSIMFFGGLNLIGIGVLGEYIARIFIETKQRPLYLVRAMHEPSEPV